MKTIIRKIKNVFTKKDERYLETDLESIKEMLKELTLDSIVIYDMLQDLQMRLDGDEL